MGKEQDIRHILKAIEKKEQEDLFIHVYPGDIAFFSLLEGTEMKEDDEREVTIYKMFLLNQQTLTNFRTDGTIFPIKKANIEKKKGKAPGEKGKAFLDGIEETGLLMYIEGKLYGVTKSAITKMRLLTGMTSAYDRSCTHDIRLAEKLLAIGPSRGTSVDLDKIDSQYAKGYTFAVSRIGGNDSVLSGMITGMYSGRYGGMKEGGLRGLCEYILDGSWTGGHDVRFTGYRLSKERIVLEFAAGDPIRYRIGGKAHTIEKCIVVTDSNNGYEAFTVNGILKDPDTGDTVEVCRKKHYHYGRTGTIQDESKNISLKKKGEIWLPAIWASLEEFTETVQECMSSSEQGRFISAAMKWGLEDCIGKKRAAAIVEKARRGTPKAEVHIVLHLKSILRSAGTKPMPLNDEQKIPKLTANAVRKAAESMRTT